MTTRRSYEERHQRVRTDCLASIMSCKLPRPKGADKRAFDKRACLAYRHSMQAILNAMTVMILSGEPGGVGVCCMR
jgi:hypothetical protein